MTVPTASISTGSAPEAEVAVAAPVENTAKPTAAIAMGNFVDAPTASATASRTTGASIPKNSPMAIASLVLGIISILLIGIILGPLAIIFGAIAINKINENPHEFQGHCMAKAGIICGIVGIVLSIIIIIIWVW